MAVRTSDFDYPLDEALIAQEPLARRDMSRLMVLGRGEGRVEHHVFRELPSLLRSGDLLVLNETAVIPARFACRRTSGGRIEGLFLRERLPGEWEVLLKGAGRCKAGQELRFEASRSEASIRLLEDLSGGRWRVAVAPAAGAMELLGGLGQSPLPPYIRRRGREHEEMDRSRYQTVYASVPGAVAAPTAGLHFTPDLLRRLEDRGIQIARLTLHVGLGTFQPVKVEDLSRHVMHTEWYDLPPGAADALNAARREGRRVVAVGTTSLRVLETVAAQTTNVEIPGGPDAVDRGAGSGSLKGSDSSAQGGAKRSPGSTGEENPALKGRSNPIAKAGQTNPGALPLPVFGEGHVERSPFLFTPGSGWTNLFIYPPHEFRAVDALITNFHLPRSTLLMLAAAFCSPGTTDGTRIILDAYAQAARLRYRFYSYGDAMLIE